MVSQEIIKQEAHIHQPTPWPVPHACSGSHRQLFRPCGKSPLWHYHQVKEREKPVWQIKDPLLQRVVQSIPYSTSSTQCT